MRCTTLKDPVTLLSVDLGSEFVFVVVQSMTLSRTILDSDNGSRMAELGIAKGFPKSGERATNS